MKLSRPQYRGVSRPQGRVGGAGVPGDPLMLIVDGVDIIGLSISDYLNVDESIRGNFFSAPDTKRSDAEIAALAFADPLLNAGTMLGIVDDILVLYQAGTSETVLNKALKAIRAKTELVDSLEMLDSLVLIGA